MEQCVRSLGDVCRQQDLPWLVTSCGWSGDEEEERLVKYIKCTHAHTLIYVLYVHTHVHMHTHVFCTHTCIIHTVLYSICVCVTGHR